MHIDIHVYIYLCTYLYVHTYMYVCIYICLRYTRDRIGHFFEDDELTRQGGGETREDKLLSALEAFSFGAC